MKKTLLCLVFLLFFVTAMTADEPIVVKLQTESQLLPVYLSPILDDDSGLANDYLKKLEEVLRFDLNVNGMTYVVKSTKDSAALDSSISYFTP